MSGTALTQAFSRVHTDNGHLAACDSEAHLGPTHALPNSGLQGYHSNALLFKWLMRQEELEL